MYIQIGEILQGAGKWQLFESKEELQCSDVDYVGAVSVALKLTNAETRILVQGTAKADITTVCARCGEEFLLPLDIEVEEGFIREDSPEADVSGIEAFDILTYKEDRLVLDEMLRQNFLAAIPMKVICRKGACKGICDQCGADLNCGPCDCKEDEIDPRWADLAKLKKIDSDLSLN